MIQCTQCLSNKADGTLWEKVAENKDNPEWVDGNAPLCQSCAKIHLGGFRKLFPNIIFEFREFIQPSTPERK